MAQSVGRKIVSQSIVCSTAPSAAEFIGDEVLEINGAACGDLGGLHKLVLHFLLVIFHVVLEVVQPVESDDHLVVQMLLAEASFDTGKPFELLELRKALVDDDLIQLLSILFICNLAAGHPCDLLNLHGEMSAWHGGTGRAAGPSNRSAHHSSQAPQLRLF
eukprot:CAMPEP_0197524176 /NCGR_PEP_ID=MMETSP1318-20131121/8916_1 /TAXON_ID=552666 /ORGANISM="Partenskyella glossopodia, Strain RCC365" /LENGTH=160 /DNA_ID=CAMNT_0043077063 /DNA_START=270 /DNA_END=749 /DNA_ORIENTATION=-